MSINLKFDFWNKNFSSQVSKTLVQYGNERIVKLQIFRRPLQKVLLNVMNILTFGHYYKQIKNQPYDTLWHVGLYAYLQNGRTLLIDKTQAVNVRLENPILDDKTEYMDINMSSRDIKLLELVQKTKDYMGEKRFFSYNAHTNNCQIFLISLLDANQINTPERNQFVYQKVDWLFRNHNYFKRLLQQATDLAGNFESFTGGSLNLHTDRTSNVELEQIANHLGFNVTFISRNEARKIKKSDAIYIVNLDDSEGSGSHWASLVVYNNEAFYIDSYGVYPPDQINKKLTKFKKAFYNSTQYQYLDSSACGLFSLGVIHYLLNNGFTVEAFDNFLDMFDYKHLKKNDLIIKKYLENVK